MVTYAGLQYDPERDANPQAGLGHRPPQTMLDRHRVTRQMRAMGATDEEVSAVVGYDVTQSTKPSPEEEEPPVDDYGLLDKAIYGIQQAASLPLKGLGEHYDIDALEWAGDVIGPSEDQERRRQEERQRREDAVEKGEMSERGKLARNVGDSAVESSGSLLGAMGAGAVAGGAVGAMGGNPFTVAIGSAIGAAAYGISSMLGEGYQQAEANGLDVDDPKVREAVAQQAVIGGSLDSVGAFRILRTFKPAVAAALAEKTAARVASRGAKEAGKNFLTEGVTEVAQEALQSILLDPDVVEKLTFKEKMELAPAVLQENGPQFLEAFLAGGLVGGTVGGVGGAMTQSKENKQILLQEQVKAAKDEQRNAQTATVAQDQGIPEAALTHDTSTEEGRAAQEEQQAEIDEISRLQTLADNAKGEQIAAEASGNEEAIAEAKANATERESALIAARDKFATKRGGNTVAQAKKQREQADKAERTERLKGFTMAGLEPVSGNADAVPTQSLVDLHERLSKAQEATGKAESIANARGKKADHDKLKKALDKEAEIRDEAAVLLQGKKPGEGTRAFHQWRKDRQRMAEHDAGIDEIIGDQFRDPDSAEDQEKARKIIEQADKPKSKEAQSKADKARKAEVAKLRNRLLSPSTNLDEKRKIREQIGVLEAGGPQADTPLVEAARRVYKGPSEDRQAEGEAAETQPTTQEATEGEAASAGSEPSQTEAAGKSPEASQAAVGEAGPAKPEVAPAAPSPEKVSDEAKHDLTNARRNLKRERSEETEAQADGAATRVLQEAGVANPTFEQVTEVMSGGGSVAQRIKRAAKMAPAATEAQAAAAVTAETGQEASPVTAMATEYEAMSIVEKAVASQQMAPRIVAEVEKAAGFRPTNQQAVDFLNGKITEEKLMTKPGPTPAEKAKRHEGFDDGGKKWTSIVDDLEGNIDADEQIMREQTAGDKIRAERSAVYDADGNLLGAGHNSNWNGVMPPKNGWGKPGHTFTHTHPYKTPFSLDDVKLMAIAAYEKVRAVLPDQTIEIRPGPNKTPIDFDRYIRMVSASLKSDPDFAAKTKGMDDVAYARIVQEAVLQDLAMNDHIDYSIPMEGFSTSEKDLISAALDIIEDYADTRYQLPAQVRNGTAQTGQAGGPAGNRDTGSQAVSPQSPAAGRQPVYPEFLAAQRAGTPVSELINRPEFTDAVNVMETLEPTVDKPGFWSEDWQQNREYNFDGETVKGANAARDRLIDGAVNLAATEMRVAPKPLAFDRKLTIITGPPASGKSSSANPIAYDLGAAIVDSDEAKKVIPEFGSGEGANAVHEESKRLIEPVEQALMEVGANIVIPKVGHEQKSIDKIARRFKGAGYEVNIVDLRVTSPEAMNRMLGRFGGTGRLIPPDYLTKEVGDKPSTVHQQMAQEGLYDGYAQLDGMVPYGTRPAILSQSGTALAGTRFEVSEGQRPERGQQQLPGGQEVGGAAEGQAPKSASGITLPRTADKPPPEGLAADPDRVADLSDAIFEASQTKSSAKGTDLERLVANKSLTKQGMRDGLQYAVGAISGTGTEASVVVLNTAQRMFPKAKLSASTFVKESVTRKNGKKAIEVTLDKDWQARMNAAYQFLNRVGVEEGMGFNKEMLPVRVNPKGSSSGFWNPTNHFSMPKAMEDYLQIFPAGASEFTRPMEDPSNTDGIVRTPKTNRLSEDALEPMRKTAARLQKNVYYLDHAYIDKLTADDLISDKKLGEVMLKRDDDGGIISGVEGATGLSPDQETFLKTQRFRASRNLQALRRMAKAHGDNPVGFRYRVDDKGRISADGRFTPQTGDAVKGIFRLGAPDGPSLKTMPTIDASASGWQVVVLLTQDEQAAGYFNLGPLVDEGGVAIEPDIALQENYAKRDMYKRLMGDLDADLRREAAAGNKQAALFVEKVLDAGMPFGKPQIKPAVIAVNYGANRSKFQEQFLNLYGDKFTGVPKPALKGMWGQVSGAAYSQLEAKAPKAMAFQNWAIDAIADLVEKVEGNRNALKGEPKVEFSVGLQGTYATLKSKEQDLSVMAKDGQDRVKHTVTVPTSEVDPRAIARSVYSQIIQGFDASILHRAYDIYDRNGGDFATSNHDSYTVPQGNAGRMAAAVRQAMKEIMTDAGDVPARLRREIETQAAEHGVTLEVQPPAGLFNDDGSFSYGGYDLNTLDKSVPMFVENYGDIPPAFTNLQGEMQPGAPAAPEIARGISNPTRIAEVAEGLGLSDQEREQINPIYKGSDMPAKKLGSNKDAAKWVENRFQLGEANRHPDFTEELTPEQLAQIGRIMAAEAQLAMDAIGNASDWYTGAMQRMYDVAAIKYPMLADDAAAAKAGLGTAANARFVFSYLMSVTSQNMKVRDNTIAADKAFAAFLESAAKGVYVLDPKFATGDKQKAMAANMEKFGALFDAMRGTPEQRIAKMDSLFREKKPVKEWVAHMKRVGLPYSAPGQTVMDAVVYGSSLLGPKIGNGFWQNLNGNYEPVTIDLWMRRTWGRLTGKSIGNISALPEQRRNMREAARRSFTQAGNRDALDAVYAQRRATLAEMRALQKRTDMTKTAKNAALKDKRLELKALEYVASDIRNIKIPEEYSSRYDKDDEALFEYAKRMKSAWDKEYKRLSTELKERLGVTKLPKGIKVPAKAQPAWARAAKRLVADQTTPLDQVANGTQRKQIERAVEIARQELLKRGLDVTPADLQAILWYPEKDLWGSLRTKLAVDEDGDPIIVQNPLNESYDTSFVEILKEQGHDVSGFETDGPDGPGGGGANPSGPAGRWADDEGAGEGAGPDGGRNPPPAPTEAKGIGLGRETYPESWLNQQGVEGISMEQAGRLVQEASRLTGIPATSVTEAEGGWADPAQPGGVSTEPSTMIDLGDASPADARRFAAVLGHMAGQHSMMVSSTNTEAPNATEIRIATDAPAAEVFAAVNALDPVAFGGFTATEDGLTLLVMGDDNPGLMQRMQEVLGGYDVTVQIQGSEAAFVGADTEGTAEGGQGYVPSLGNVGVGQAAAERLLGDAGRASEEIFGLRPTPAAGISMFARVKDAPLPPGLAGPQTRESWVGRSARSIANSNGPKMQAAQTVLGKLGRSIERAIFNRQAGAKQLQRLVGAAHVGIRDGMHQMMQMMTATSGRIGVLMERGALKWNPQKMVFEVAKHTKGLAQIFTFNDVADYHTMQQYAYAKRDEALPSVGKSHRMDDSLRAQWLAVTPEQKARYDAMLNDYRVHREAMIDLMVDSGLRTKEAGDALKAEGDYVPFFREFNDPEEFGMQSFFGGSTDGFNHPDPKIRSMAQDAMKVGERIYIDSQGNRHNVSMTQYAANPAAYDGMELHRDGGAFGDLMEAIQKSEIAMLHAVQQNIAHKQIHKFLTGSFARDIRTKAGIKVKKVKGKKGGVGPETDAFSFYDNGEKVEYRLKADTSNPMAAEMVGSMMVAISGLKPIQMDGFDRTMKAFNNWQRLAITGTPAFAVRSMMRDSMQSYVQTGTKPLETFKQNMKAFGEIARGYDEKTYDLMAASGIAGYQLQGMPEASAESFRKRVGAERKGFLGVVRQGIGEWERAMGATEIGARTAVAEGIRSKGGSDVEAAYEALNMIDYNRKGASRTLQRLMNMVLFLNPRLQGLYRLWETSSGDPSTRMATVSKHLAMRGLMLTGIAMALRAAISADDEAEEAYRALSTQERATYFNVPIGGGRFLRIPKPFELGAVFGTVPQQIYDSATAPNGWNEGGLMASHILMETFSFNPMPEVAVPLYEVMTNKDTFTGREIESKYDDTTLKSQRMGYNTSGIAQTTGNAVLSPAQIDHMVRGYLGPLGVWFYDAVDATMAGLGLVPERSAKVNGIFGPASHNILAGSFVSKTDKERSQAFVGQFYDVHDRIAQYTKAINAADADADFYEKERLIQSAGGLLAVKKQFAAAKREMTRLNKLMKDAQTNPKWSDEERQTRMQQINVRRNRIARNAITAAEAAGVRGSFAGGLIGYGLDLS